VAHECFCRAHTHKLCARYMISVGEYIETRWLKNIQNEQIIKAKKENKLRIQTEMKDFEQLLPSLFTWHMVQPKSKHK